VIYGGDAYEITVGIEGMRGSAVSRWAPTFVDGSHLHSDQPRNYPIAASPNVVAVAADSGGCRETRWSPALVSSQEAVHRLRLKSARCSPTCNQTFKRQ
jgi:hypothetical protein